MPLFGSNYSEVMWCITYPKITNRIRLETPLTSSPTYKFMSEVAKLIWWRWPAKFTSFGWNDGSSFDAWTTYTLGTTPFSRWGSNPCKIYDALTSVVHNESFYIKGYIVRASTNSFCWLSLRQWTTYDSLYRSHVTGSSEGSRPRID